jgi:hypothetical protein
LSILGHSDLNDDQAEFILGPPPVAPAELWEAALTAATDPDAVFDELLLPTDPDNDRDSGVEGILTDNDFDWAGPELRFDVGNHDVEQWTDDENEAGGHHHGHPEA